MRKASIMLVVSGLILTIFTWRMLDNITTYVVEYGFFNLADMLAMMTPEGSMRDAAMNRIVSMKSCVCLLLSAGGWISVLVVLKPYIRRLLSY